MGKITKLTAEQSARAPKFREEWLRVGLSCEPINRAESRAAVEALYAAAGQPTPVVMYFPSPAQCILALHVLKGANLRENLRENLGANLRANLWANLGANLRANLWANLGANLRANLGENLWANLGANLRANLGENLGENLGANLFIDTWFWGGQDAPWLAFYEFGQEIGVRYAKADHFSAYLAYARTSGWMYAYPGLALISDRPEVIVKDDANRLHCEMGPALRFRDGYSVHCWHGRNVPAAWIEQRGEIDPAEIIAHENVEMRAVGAEIVGWPRMLSSVDCRVIAKGATADIGDLIELTLPGLDAPGRFLRAKCPRNGLIVEGLPRTSEIDGQPIDTPLAAQAWRVGLSQAEYRHPTERT